MRRSLREEGGTLIDLFTADGIATATDEKLHIKALSRRINSLEAEKIVLLTRNEELEYRLNQLGKNVSDASVVASVTPVSCAAEVMSSLGRTNECQEIAGPLQWSAPENSASAYENQYDEKLVNSMRTELNSTREECSLVKEKIVQMGCINFELECELKDAKEKLEKAEIRARQADKKAEQARQNCAQQKKLQESLHSKFLAKSSALEKELNDLKQELVLKNEQLEAKTIENNKWNEESKQWKFAMHEMEAVHKEIQMLEEQLNNEKAAMESRWEEVRTILLEGKEDMSRKTSGSESVVAGEQSEATKHREMMDTITELKNTVDKQTEQLEHDKAQKQKFETAIRHLQGDKKAVVVLPPNNDKKQHVVPYETQIIGLQRQRDFMDREMTLLCALNNSKDVLIQALKTKLEGICSEKPVLSDVRSDNDSNKERDKRIDQLQEQIEVIVEEKSEALNSLTKSKAELERLQTHVQRLQVECDQHKSQLQLSLRGNLNVASSNSNTHQHEQLEFVSCAEDLLIAEEMANDADNKSVNVEMKVQMERLTEALQQKNTELQKVLNENEALKIKCVESTAALDLLSNELERRSREKDAIIEMLQSQHTYLTQTLLVNENEKQSITLPMPLLNKHIEHKNVMRDASTNMDAAENLSFPVILHCETQTDFDFSEIIETGQKLISEPSCKVIRDDSIVEFGNRTSRSSQMHENLADDVRQLMILNADLETAVEVLKGEIWTLNEQLKGAAAAENESNRRLVEWQEKSAQMENSRTELENAYGRLSEYYQQLQQAYNALYARFNAHKVDSDTQTIVDSNSFKIMEESAEKVECLNTELAQRKADLNREVLELQHVRNLLREHLYVALKNVRELREVHLKLLKDVVLDNIQTIRVEMHEILKNVHSYAEEVIVRWFKEKEMKDAEITLSMQELVSGILIENVPQTDLWSTIVDSVSAKFLDRKGSERTALQDDLLNERNDENVEIKMPQDVSEKEESELKIKKLEDLLQATQFSLTEHIIRCQQLQAKLDLLGSATDQSTATAAQSGSSGSDLWNCSTPCTICRELRQTKQPAPTPQLQLAILAARLTIKIADNDALFRCNAELAQTNLRLQNEVSELREHIAKCIASTNSTATSDTNQQSVFQQNHISKQSSNQSLEQKMMHVEKKEWTWDPEDFDVKLVNSSKFENGPQQSSSDQQIAGFTMKDEMKMSNLTELEFQEEETLKKSNASKKFEKKNGKMENHVENLKKYLEVSGQSCSKREIKVEQVEDELEMEQLKDAKHKQELEKFENKKLKISGINCEEPLPLENENMQLKGFMGSSDQELEGRLEEEFQCTRTSYKDEGIHHELFEGSFTERLEEQEKAVKRKLVDENDWISDGISKRFQILLEEQVQNVPGGSTVEDEMQLMEALRGQFQQKEIEVQQLEKRNRSLSEQLKSQQRLIEGLGKKLGVTEKYSMTLEEKNVSVEEKSADQKKKYEELLMEKERLKDEVVNEVRSKFLEEIMLLTQKNESLVEELARKQALLDREEASVSNEVVNLKCQLTSREIALEELKTKLEHTQKECIQVQRQLEDSIMQMSELQKKNEINQEFRKKLVEAQEKIEELERRLDEMLEQNRLLKNGEGKLMDALAISNKQLAEKESKNERLKSEISGLQASLLKAKKMAKKIDHSEKSVMHDDESLVDDVHGKAETSLATMQAFDNPVTVRRFYPVQKEIDGLKEEFNEISSDNTLVKSFETASQTYYFPHVNEDKLRRRKGGGGGFQGAEKM
ncbi:unnamed protein product [Litomosoides sigmodontis]|uniref:Uncharacterized protein n=1 Tax=Litomosoides sigmodontis TaxID=42156 RepID=A0A3P6UAX1_LITSI|nr:unnamed protein product [Litomosoides sigmodontis]